MPDISSIGHGPANPINRPGGIPPRPGAQPPSAVPAPQGDRVELSEHARLLERLRHMPRVRPDLVEALRKSIADGTYQSPEKLDAAIELLLQQRFDLP